MLNFILFFIGKMWNIVCECQFSFSKKKKKKFLFLMCFNKKNVEKFFVRFFFAKSIKGNNIWDVEHHARVLLHQRKKNFVRCSDFFSLVNWIFFTFHQTSFLLWLGQMWISVVCAQMRWKIVWKKQAKKKKNLIEICV